VWKNRLTELELPVGPWLKELKDQVMRGAPDDQPVRAWWRDRNGEHERHFTVGALKNDILRLVPGEKIAYVTDAAFHDDNRRRIVDLARDAMRLFIECAFLDEDAALAAARSHLTAGQAGLIARESGAEFVTPFHFSPRYEGREAELRAEVEATRDASP
jgi:ribonuclease Z